LLVNRLAGRRFGPRCALRSGPFGVLFPHLEKKKAQAGRLGLKEEFSRDQEPEIVEFAA
jgi:hypothetical protein